MSLRERIVIKPLLVKFGSLLAISLAGILYSRYRNKRIKPSLPSSSPCSPVKSGERRARVRDESHGPSPAGKETPEHTYKQKTAINRSAAGLSPSTIHNGDRDGFLLPVFNDYVSEMDLAADTADGGHDLKKVPIFGSSKDFTSAGRDACELEVRSLRKMIRTLKERENLLEVRLLEFYDLDEQDTEAMDLQSRLNAKINSLQADNRRLEEQAADHSKLLAELEAARSKLRLLKKKIRSEAQQNKEHVLTLQNKLARFQDQELGAVVVDPDIQKKLQMFEDLEVETEELRESNMRFQIENSELARQLESTQILVNSMSKDPETEELKEESNRLRHENEELTKEVEKFKSDRCSEVEELVYLRWVNACLRHELRNYQPIHTKTVARDLSKNPSLKSEEKMKQLFLEYAQAQENEEKSMNTTDFDSDRWSSSQASNAGDLDESPMDTPSTRISSKTKRKFFDKLKNLIRGKDHHQSRNKHSDRATSPDGWDSSDQGSVAGGDTMEFVRNRIPPPPNPSRRSLDLGKLRRHKGENREDVGGFAHRKSDVGSYRPDTWVLGRTGSIDSATKSQLEMDSDSRKSVNSDFMQFAEALKDSESQKSLHQKSEPYTFD